MKLTWLIENFTDSPDYQDLIEAVRKSGRVCHVIDKRNNFEFKPDAYRHEKLLLFQGSIQLGKLVKKSLPESSPVLFCNDSAFLCTSYYPVFQDYLFNDRHVATTVNNLKNNKFEYYARYGKEALIFIRPDGGDKPFTGQLLDLQDFERFWANNVVCNVADSDIIYISTPKEIIGEWRFVVSHSKIIAQSTYVFQNQKTLIPSAPKKATELVLELLKVGYHPDPVYCIDICQGKDELFYLLELGSFSHCGLYACDKDDIVKEVSELIETTI